MDKGSKWALLIGIDKYHESLGSLKYSGEDCRAIRDSLINGTLGFPEDQVLMLGDDQDYDHKPTFANIHSYTASWLAAPSENDLVFVYFAGHGRLIGGRSYLVPGDATISTIHTLGIPLKHFQDTLEQCKAKRKILILDACHSGAGRDVCTMEAPMQEAISMGSGFYTIASCAADELSHEWAEKRHGAFSYFLSEALNGGISPSADGNITIENLYEWVHSKVIKWSAQHRCSQTPQRFAKGSGPIILVESAPDYAALAEQYRKELEETRAKLASMGKSVSNPSVTISPEGQHVQVEEQDNESYKRSSGYQEIMQRYEGLKQVAKTDVAKNEVTKRKMSNEGFTEEAIKKSEQPKSSVYSPEYVRAFVVDKPEGLLRKRRTLCILDDNGKETVVLDLTKERKQNAKDVDLSPDGRRILFINNGHLHVINTNGKHLVDLYGLDAVSKRAGDYRYPDKHIYNVRGSKWTSSDTISATDGFCEYVISLNDSNRPRDFFAKI